MPPEYAPRGLLGVLTPQANTTVEPELAILLPPGVAMLNARMMSDKATIAERLADYLAALPEHVAQFANAPIGAILFATTGASYVAGPAGEDRLVAGLEDRLGIPVVTAARAVCDGLRALGATRIALVSPYPAALTEAAVGYWRARGLAVSRVVGAELQAGAFHPIYAMAAGTAAEALATLRPDDADAVVMLGTGMPTLRPILGQPRVGAAPVLSCILALGWRGVAAVTGGAVDAASLLRWVDGEGWRGRYAAQQPPAHAAPS